MFGGLGVLLFCIHVTDESGVFLFSVLCLQTHILPREICGKSTFLVAMVLMKSLPVWLTDRLLVAYTFLTLGDTASVGIPRPSEGPMSMKETSGKTPILDVGTFAAIKSGQVKVCTLNPHLQTQANLTSGNLTVPREMVINQGYFAFCAGEASR